MLKLHIASSTGVSGEQLAKHTLGWLKQGEANLFSSCWNGHSGVSDSASGPIQKEVCTCVPSPTEYAMCTPMAAPPAAITSPAQQQEGGKSHVKGRPSTVRPCMETARITRLLSTESQC